MSGKDHIMFFASFLLSLLCALWATAAMLHFIPYDIGQWWGLPLYMTIVTIGVGIFIGVFMFLTKTMFYIESKLNQQHNR